MGAEGQSIHLHHSEDAFSRKPQMVDTRSKRSVPHVVSSEDS